MRLLFLLFGALGSINGQLVSVGICPQLKGVSDFDINKYMGKWFERYRYETQFQWGGDCVEAEYKLNNVSSVNVTNIMVRNGKIKKKTATAELINEGVGEFNIKFSDEKTTKYIILNTDYENFALVYSCTDLSFINHEVYTWILSRTPHLSLFSKLAINETMVKSDLLWQNYRDTSHTCKISL